MYCLQGDAMCVECQPEVQTGSGRFVTSADLFRWKRKSEMGTRMSFSCAGDVVAGEETKGNWKMANSKW